MSSSDSRYELRLPRAEKEALQTRADALGVPLATAFRKGADLWLTSRELDATPIPDETQELISDVYALANKIDRRLRGR